MPFDPLNPLSITQIPGGPNTPLGGPPPAPPPQSPLKSAGDSKETLFNEIARLTGDDGALASLRSESDRASKAQVDNLMQESEYSNLDKVMAGLAGINLGQVPQGYSSLAIGMQGTRDAATKFAELKGAYKQKALDIQAQAAQKAYQEQLTYARDMQKLAMQEKLANVRATSAENIADKRARAQTLLAQLKAAQVAGKVPDSLITEAMKQAQAEFEGNQIPAEQKQARYEEILAQMYASHLNMQGRPPAAIPTGAQAPATPTSSSGIPIVAAPGTEAQVAAEVKGYESGDPTIVPKDNPHLVDPSGAPHPDMVNAPLPPGFKPKASGTMAATLAAKAAGAKEAEVGKAKTDEAARAAQISGTPENIANRERSEKEIAESKKDEDAINAVNSFTESTLADIDHLLNYTNPKTEKRVEGKQHPGLEAATGPWQGQYDQAGNQWYNPTFSDKTADAQAFVNGLLSKLSTKGLEEMRARAGSPGSITEKEWGLFERSLVTLSRTMGTPQFVASLKQTRKLLEDLRNKSTTAIESKRQKSSALPGVEGATEATGRTVVRRVKLKDGRTGVEYSDGTRGFE